MTECICPGGWDNCLYGNCPSCKIVDQAEEPPPCADDDEVEEHYLDGDAEPDDPFIDMDYLHPSGG